MLEKIQAIWHVDPTEERDFIITNAVSLFAASRGVDMTLYFSPNNVEHMISNIHTFSFAISRDLEKLLDILRIAETLNKFVYTIHLNTPDSFAEPVNRLNHRFIKEIFYEPTDYFLVIERIMAIASNL